MIINETASDFTLEGDLREQFYQRDVPESNEMVEDTDLFFCDETGSPILIPKSNTDIFAAAKPLIGQRVRMMISKTSGTQIMYIKAAAEDVVQFPPQSLKQDGHVVTSARKGVASVSV